MTAPLATRLCVVFALAALAPREARGQAAAPDDERAALALAQEGLRARREHRDAEALTFFERSYARAPRASVRAQMGFAQQALGRWVDAERTLTEVAASDDPWVRRFRATIDEALATVRSHLGSLTVASTPADAELWVDGQLSNTGATIRLPVGTVSVRATREGYFALERTVTIVAGETASETIVLGQRPPPETVATPATRVTPAARVVSPSISATRVTTTSRDDLSSDRGPSRWIAPAALAAGGALAIGAGAGVWFVREGALRALSARGCVETSSEWICDPSAIDPNLARSEHALATTSSAAAIATMTVGAAAIAGGAVWLAIEATRGSSSARARRAWWIGPGVLRWAF
jgi:hypothetical protein